MTNLQIGNEKYDLLNKLLISRGGFDSLQTLCTFLHKWISDSPKNCDDT